METQELSAPVRLPRVAIIYCTQCKWMLRAAWFGQELLSTFGTNIGEIALIPATGGIFTVKLSYIPPSALKESKMTISEVLIWDRESEGGFPEAKILKQLIRNHIDPEKNLGHSDTPSSKGKESVSKASKDAGSAPSIPQEQPNQETAVGGNETPCDDCK